MTPEEAPEVATVVEEAIVEGGLPGLEACGKLCCCGCCCCGCCWVELVVVAGVSSGLEEEAATTGAPLDSGWPLAAVLFAAAPAATRFIWLLVATGWLLIVD